MALKFRDLFKPRSSAEPASVQIARTALPVTEDSFQQAQLLQQQGKLEQAIALFDVFIAQQPDHAEAHYKRANALNALGRWEAALADYDRAVSIRPDYANAYCNRGTVLERLHRWDDALASYERTIALDPGDFLAFYNRGSVLKELNRPREALASYQQAVALRSDYVDALVNQGHVLQELHRYVEAVASYDRAIELRPIFPEAFMGRGNALFSLTRNEEALASYDRAIAQRSDYAECSLNRANVLKELQRFDEAVVSYNRAIALRPIFPEAFMGRGNALVCQMQLDAALASYDHAIALRSEFAECYLNRANLLQGMQRYDEAVASYDKTLELKPDDAEAHRNRGLCLVVLRRFVEAIASYDRSLVINPDQKYVLGMRHYAKSQSCDWTARQQEVEQLIVGLEALRPVSVPLPVLAAVDSPALHRLAAEIWVREECPPSDRLGAIPVPVRGERIRVGYFSADFRIHPVALLTAQMFESHDRSRFQTIAFALGPECEDEVRQRLRPAFDRFIDISQTPDNEVASLSRKHGVDIAVDLGGFTQNSRTKIFALRAAPVQVNFLGYAGTMGANYIDYLIADRVLIPEGSARHFAEKIIYLPDCYLPNDSARLIAERHFTRGELGLPAFGFVFCCFNRSFKLTPEIYDRWMRILRRVDGSVLWISESEPAVVARLRLEAQRRGIDPERLVFARRMPSMADHLARQRVAGLFLDTLPFNAHTTASDALWAGLPVLTCAGQAFPGRVAASLLTAIGLPELITNSGQEFEDLAVRLAQNPAELERLRLKLAANRLSTALFDTLRFTRNLESAFVQIYERCQANLPPDHIVVGA